MSDVDKFIAETVQPTLDEMEATKREIFRVGREAGMSDEEIIQMLKRATEEVIEDAKRDHTIH